MSKIKTETFEQFVGEPSEVIYKKLKTLDVIKEKQPNLYLLSMTTNYEEYNQLIRINYANYKNYLLTQKEYDLLKEVLNNGK